jgi:hypothetical protein
MTENEFEYCWALVLLAMSREGILREVADEWSGNLANMRDDFHDIWVDGVMRRMGFGRGFRLDFNQADGDGGLWVTADDDRRDDSMTPEARKTAADGTSRELNDTIVAFLNAQMERRKCAICKNAIGTADPDAVARRDTFKHMEFAGHEFGHAKCCGVVTAGWQFPKRSAVEWVTVRDLSPRQIVLP